jgi:hypothetical protein
VLKKTSASIGLVIAAAAAAPLTSSPAYAHANQLRGWHGNHHYSSHRSHHRNHNWNGNRHHGRVFIRIYIYNKNNNHAVAIARPEHREARPASFLGDDTPFFGGAGVGGLNRRDVARTNRDVPATGTTGVGNTGTGNTGTVPVA